MKKLKTKVFSVVFLIMTLVVVAVFAVYNVQLYNQEKTIVRRGINGIDQTVIEKSNILSQAQDNDSKSGKNDFKDGNYLFVDSTIYTVVLDCDNNLISAYNHSNTNAASFKNVISVAKKIAEKGKNEKIGNLFFTKYSYKVTAYQPISLIGSVDTGNYKFITIVDNSNTNRVLNMALLESLVILIILELAIFFISRKIADWIAKPVAESFYKQKLFVADASHELKTPLAVIIASADALESNPTEKKWLNNIKSEGDRMNKLIADLLELAKSDEVNDKTTFAVGNLSKLVEKSTLTFESVMFEKGVILNDNIQPDIELNMSELKIQQLLGILLDNAIKHSEKGSEICVDLKQDKEITLTVTNKGEGIPKGEEEKIFERFYRADESRNRNENRYGLGLAIAKNIVTAHGGTISAKSENGFTVFKVVFKIPKSGKQGKNR